MLYFKEIEDHYIANYFFDEKGHTIKDDYWIVDYKTTSYESAR